jgi:phosphohistidine phosphatase
MKTLIITRHGKAEQRSKGSDFLRELTSKGFKDVKTIASELEKYNLAPDLIICSPSKRTTETAEQIIKYFNNIKIHILLQDYLYLGFSNGVFDLIDSVYPDSKIVMIVGHNPSLEILVKKLSGVVLDLPTSSTVAMDFNIDNWRDLIEVKGLIRKLIIP